jgi:hypothetical protein
VVVAGTALDNIGVVQVSWSTDKGLRGVAYGTNSWSTPSVPVEVGSNVVTITARDAAGNTASTTITVSRVVNSGPLVND